MVFAERSTVGVLTESKMKQIDMFSNSDSPDADLAMIPFKIGLAMATAALQFTTLYLGLFLPPPRPRLRIVRNH